MRSPLFRTRNENLSAEISTIRNTRRHIRTYFSHVGICKLETVYRDGATKLMPVLADVTIRDPKEKRSTTKTYL